MATRVDIAGELVTIRWPPSPHRFRLVTSGPHTYLVGPDVPVDEPPSGRPRADGVYPLASRLAELRSSPGFPAPSAL